MALASCSVQLGSNDILNSRCGRARMGKSVVFIDLGVGEWGFQAIIWFLLPMEAIKYKATFLQKKSK